MAKISRYFCVAFASSQLLALAGDNEPHPRKEFHQQKEYPYTFAPVAYLENQGPQAMRFGMPANDCSRHDPPPLPTPRPSPTPTPSPANSAAANPKPQKEAKPTPAPLPVPPIDQSASNQGSQPQPEYPPPQNAHAGASDQADLNRAPDEVMAYFKNPYNSPQNSHRLFDPLFEPAFVHKAPPSKATYNQE